MKAKLETSLVSFEAFPSHILLALREAADEGQPVGACFVIDQGRGVIYYDAESPVEVLAPFILHELTHACTDSLWAMDGVAVSRASREQVIIEAELLAYEAQYRFLCEMEKLRPEMKRFLEERFPKVRMFHNKLSIQEVRALYGSKAA